jgi:hypothetical protein
MNSGEDMRERGIKLFLEYVAFGVHEREEEKKLKTKKGKGGHVWCEFLSYKK